MMVRKFASVFAAVLLFVVTLVTLTVSADNTDTSSATDFDFDNDGVVDIYDLALLKRECANTPNDPRLIALSNLIHNRKDSTTEANHTDEESNPQIPAISWMDLTITHYSAETTKSLIDDLNGSIITDFFYKDSISLIKFQNEDFEGTIKIFFGIPDNVNAISVCYDQSKLFYIATDGYNYYAELYTNNQPYKYDVLYLVPRLAPALAFWNLCEDTYSYDLACNLANDLKESTIRSISCEDDIVTITFSKESFDGIIKAYRYNKNEHIIFDCIYSDPDSFSLVTDMKNYYIEIK